MLDQLQVNLHWVEAAISAAVNTFEALLRLFVADQGRDELAERAFDEFRLQIQWRHVLHGFGRIAQISQRCPIDVFKAEAFGIEDVNLVQSGFEDVQEPRLRLFGLPAISDIAHESGEHVFAIDHHGAEFDFNGKFAAVLVQSDRFYGAPVDSSLPGFEIALHTPRMGTGKMTRLQKGQTLTDRSRWRVAENLQQCRVRIANDAIRVHEHDCIAAGLPEQVEAMLALITRLFCMLPQGDIA